MDGSHFDSLVRSLFSAATRRDLFAVLAALPVVGALSVLRAEATDAKDRRRRRKHRNQRHSGGGKKNRTGKRKGDEKGKDKCAKTGQAPKKGTPCCDGLVREGAGICAVPLSATSPPTPCIPRSCPPGGCGSLPDGCGGSLMCGGCAATHLCDGGVCQPCTVLPGGDLQAALTGGGTVYVCPGTYTGNFIITENLTLIGAGDGANPATNTILTAGGTGRVVESTTSGRTVVMRDLRITGGSCDSGCGVSKDDNTLEMTRCTVTGNAATSTVAQGAGIQSAGPLTLTECTITENVTTGSAFTIGGGIFHQATAALTMTRCLVSDNKALGSNCEGGGMAIGGTTATLIDTEVSGNETSGLGGGIHNFGRTLTTSTLILRGTTSVTDNDANPTPPSGGIFNDGGTVTIEAGSSVTGTDPTTVVAARHVEGAPHRR